MLDFYTTGHQLITDAITRFQQTHASSTAAKREQLATGKKEIRDNAAAVDRYLTAVEKGTLDDDAPEIRASLDTLKNQSKALRARKAELELDLEQPPQVLTSADMNAIRAEIRHILTNETHNARKALLRDPHPGNHDRRRRHRPTRLQTPANRNDEGPAQNGLTLTDRDANQIVRALPTLVDHTWQNKNRVFPVQAPDVVVTAVRRRVTDGR